MNKMDGIVRERAPRRPDDLLDKRRGTGAHITTLAATQLWCVAKRIWPVVRVMWNRVGGREQAAQQGDAVDRGVQQGDTGEGGEALRTDMVELQQQDEKRQNYAVPELERLGPIAQKEEATNGRKALQGGSVGTQQQQGEQSGALQGSESGEVVGQTDERATQSAHEGGGGERVPKTPGCTGLEAVQAAQDLEEHLCRQYTFRPPRAEDPFQQAFGPEPMEVEGPDPLANETATPPEVIMTDPTPETHGETEDRVKILTEWLYEQLKGHYAHFTPRATPASQVAGNLAPGLVHCS
ncbi:hypothetical protein CBR_g89335 [Chara braunii]|uniref:Uncharacterized protein n=1 Tax=Chara braunii TaxID=69332 RepID=A0A388JKR1_CHABU|nr:hypothetical protein CBR_g89335 [Chara braunii]|eukprot:GBG45263.1 hypothetical protein CBR_g89335 [Chara braunii]